MKNRMPGSSESTTGIGRNIFLLKNVHRKHLSVLSQRSEQFEGLERNPAVVLSARQISQVTLRLFSITRHCCSSQPAVHIRVSCSLAAEWANPPAVDTDSPWLVWSWPTNPEASRRSSPAPAPWAVRPGSEHSSPSTRCPLSPNSCCLCGRRPRPPPSSPPGCWPLIRRFYRDGRPRRSAARDWWLWR